MSKKEYRVGTLRYTLPQLLAASVFMAAGDPKFGVALQPSDTQFESDIAGSGRCFCKNDRFAGGDYPLYS